MNKKWKSVAFAIIACFQVYVWTAWRQIKDLGNISVKMMNYSCLVFTEEQHNIHFQIIVWASVRWDGIIEMD